MIDELKRIRAEVGWPPLAAPIGQMLASQALLHVLSAERYQTVVDELRALLAAGSTARRPARSRRPSSARSTLLPTGGDRARCRRLDELRERYAGLAASEEELLLLALFGDEAEPLLETIRGARHAVSRSRPAASTRPAPSGSARSSASSRSRASAR